MKVLYAIQATGNGHISRAKELIPLLQKNIEVDVLLSGTSADIELEMPVRFRFKGLSFVFGKNGGINIWKTIVKMDFWRFFRDIKQ
ncbi:MAG: glycosyl transferase, partial [Bacteroidetes bacterium]|nr:glycosyl transferase [Bacteroidota bacterium]